jgi:hypothetical protein
MKTNAAMLVIVGSFVVLGLVYIIKPKWTPEAALILPGIPP